MATSVAATTLVKVRGLRGFASDARATIIDL
jgi:hypothetical protein